MSDSTAANTESTFKYYHYDPSAAAAGLFTALFFLATILHSYQMIRTRTWIFVPFVIGGVMEALGYIGVSQSCLQTTWNHLVLTCVVENFVRRGNTKLDIGTLYHANTVAPCSTCPLCRQYLYGARTNHSINRGRMP